MLKGLSALASPENVTLMLASVVLSLLATIYVQPFLKRHSRYLTYSIIGIVGVATVYLAFVTNYEGYGALFAHNPDEAILILVITFGVTGTLALCFIMCPVFMTLLTIILWTLAFVTLGPDAKIIAPQIIMILTMLGMLTCPPIFIYQMNREQKSSDEADQ